MGHHRGPEDADGDVEHLRTLNDLEPREEPADDRGDVRLREEDLGEEAVLLAPFANLSWWAVVASHLAAGGIILLIGIGMFAMDWLGGGDAKIIAAAALWLGFDHLLPFLTQTAVFGGLLAVAILAYRRFPAAAMRLPDWALRLHKPCGGIPYGVAIGAAALAVYPATPWFAAFAS